MYLNLENSRTSSEDLEMTIAALKYPHSQNEDDLCHAVEISWDRSIQSLRTSYFHGEGSYSFDVFIFVNSIRVFYT